LIFIGCQFYCFQITNYKLLVIAEKFSADTCSITFILDMGIVLMETESGAFS